MSLKSYFFSFFWIASLLTTGSIFRFSMFDEMLCLFILFSSIKRGFLRSKTSIIFTTYVFFHILISIIYGYNGLKPILLDALMYAKPFVCAIACGSGYFVLRSKDNAILNKLIYLLLIVFFIDSVAALFVGARDVASRPPFWFTTNCTLAGTTTLMLLFYIFTENGQNKNKLILREAFLYGTLILTAMITMQGKYSGFVFCVFLLKIFCEKILPSIQSTSFRKRSISRFFSVFLFIISFLGALYLSLDDLHAYYLTDNENVARAMMARSLPKVLDGPFFFTGRGFGAFCSPVTSAYYPPSFMDDIGLSNVYGLSRAYSNLMSDGYLWSFAGCFGFFGIFLFFLFLAYMFKPFFKLLRLNALPPKLGFACLVCFTWIAIFAFGSGLMFGYGVFVMLLWGILRWKAVLTLQQEQHNYSNKK